jgi:hypothetical protein
LGFDLERYARHPKLDDAQARRRAGLDLRHRPRRNWEVSLSAVYATTNNAGDLNTATGIEVGRFEARRLTLAPSLAHRLDEVTTATASYSFDEIRGGITARTKFAALVAERRLGGQDTAEAAYRARGFAFDGSSAGTAHLVTLLWSRRVRAMTRLRIEAGPRLYRSRLGAEVAAVAEQRLRRGEASLRYAKTQATMFGQSVVVDVDAWTAVLAYSPVRSLRLSAAPALYRSAGGGRRARVRRLDLATAWRLGPRLSIAASHELSVQTGALAGVAEGRIPRQVFTVRMVAGEN